MRTSRDLAQEFGKNHSDVMRDIRKAYVDYTPSTYTNKQGRSMPCLCLLPESYQIMVDKYSGKLRMPLSAREDLVLRGVEWVLGYELHRQYKVGSYRIDGYDPHTNTTYEVDEEQHRSQVQADQERQRFITEVLGCTFKRINI